MHFPQIELVKIRMLIAVMALNFFHSITLYYGNLSTYMYSVFYLDWSREKTNDLDPSWMLGIYLAGYVIGTLSLDAIRTMMSLRLSVALGILIYDTGLFLTYFTISHSVWATTLTFAVTGGLGTGILESTVLLYVAGWFKDIVGLVTSLAFASAAMGSVVINQVITAFINPNDLTPDSMRGQIAYFSQAFVVERVPKIFLIIAALSFSLHITSFCLLKKPGNHAVGEVHCHKKNQTTECESSSEEMLRINDHKLKVPKSGANSSSDSTQLSPSQSLQTDGDTSETSSLSEAPSSVESGGMSPLEVLRSENFYYLCLADIGESFGNVVVANYYKIFGQLWVEGDHFFAHIGSSASFLAIVFQVIMGYLVDLLGVKKALVLNLAVASVLLSFWYFTLMISKWLYLLCTIILLCLFMTQFVLIPVAVLKLFGSTYLASNLGLILTASLISYLISPPVVTSLLHYLGWFWLFFVVAAVCFVPIIPIIVRMPNQQR